MKSAVIYARVSTSRQADEELPIDGQVERCKAKAADLGARVDQVFVDAGLSGRTDQRPAFRDAIDYCELVSPDYFITWSTSRFARSKYDAAMYKMRLQRAGVEIVYLAFPVDRETDAGFLTESVLEIFDEFHSRQIASDTRRSMLRLASQGYFCGGRPPFGFRSVPAHDNPRRRRLEVVVEEAEIIELIFEMRESGLGAKSIADELNRQGHKNRTRRWAQASVLHVLRSEALIGVSVFNRKDRSTGRQRPPEQWVRVQSHEPIIARDRWETVQDMIRDDTPKRQSGSPLSQFLFTGLARCACGGSLQTETATGRTGKRYNYYRCRRHRTGGKCTGRRLPAQEFDAWMLELIAERIFSRANLLGVLRELAASASHWSRDRDRRMQRAQRQLAQIEERQAKLYGILELHGRGAPDLGDLTLRLRANKRRIEALEIKIVAIESEEAPELTITESDLDELREFLMECLRSTEDVTKTRNFFRDFIQEIRVEASEVHIHYRPDRLVGAPVVRSTENWLPGRGLLRTASAGLPGRLRAVA